MNAIEIKDLCKSYKGFSLENINLTLPSGCTMGLIGANGAGKSTTIKLILDIIKKDSGSVTILGKDNKDNLALTKQEIGVVLDEVGIPEYLKAKQVGNIMKLIFNHWDEKMFYDYLQKLSIPENKKFKDFSRGTKMKLGIAVAFSHHPKLLILDEATSGLDPVVRDEVIDMLYEFTKDRSHSVLISSHIVSDLEKICDYVAFLNKGNLLLCDKKDDLKSRYGIISIEPEKLDTIPKQAIKGKKEYKNVIEVMVQRDKVPNEINVSPIDLEKLFLFMVQEEI